MALNLKVLNLSTFKVEGNPAVLTYYVLVDKDSSQDLQQLWGPMFRG